MAATNKTPNYNLPQWSESDKIEFSPDVNNAFSAIDAGMKANAANIGLLSSALVYLGNVSGLNSKFLATGYGMINAGESSANGYPCTYGVILVLGAGPYIIQAVIQTSGGAGFWTRGSADWGSNFYAWQLK